MVMNKCTILDPSLKSLAHLTEDEHEATVISIIDDIVLHSIQVTMTSTSLSTQIAPPPPKKKCVLEKLLGSTFSQTAENSESLLSVLFNELVRAELSWYKSEQVLELKENPMKCWKAHHQAYPHLAKMAQKYLGVVATSVQLERLFSAAGIVVNTKRSALDPENVEKLVFLHDNLPPLCSSYKRTAH